MSYDDVENVMNAMRLLLDEANDLCSLKNMNEIEKRIRNLDSMKFLVKLEIDVVLVFYLADGYVMLRTTWINDPLVSSDW